MSTNDTQRHHQPGSRSGLLRGSGIGAVAMFLLAGLGALLVASIPYPHTGQPGQPSPFGEYPSGRPASRNWLKLVIMLVLLAGLGWVLALGVQYFLTKQSITQLTGVPPPISGLFKGQPRYISSLEGVERPLGVAISNDGTVYVTESAGERMVRAFNSDGDQIAEMAPSNASRVPLYIAISPDDEIYVSDRLNRAVHMFSADGTFIRAYQPQSVPAEDWHPMGLAFDENGNFYVTDVTQGKHRVMVFDSSGALTLQFGTEGKEPGQFWYPNGIGVDGEGRIYVADGNNGRLQVFDQEGQLLYLIARGFASGDLGMPRGVAVDDHDRLFVVDTAAGVVKVYDISGDRPDYIRDIGADGEFSYPNGIAVDGSRIYVTDREHARVQIWNY